MRIAIISDIHTNTKAVSAVFETIEDSCVDEVWSLGDWFGYGSDNATNFWLVIRDNLNRWDLINRPVNCVLGNHDLALLDKKILYDFNVKALGAIHNQWEQLENTEIWMEEIHPWLHGLPYVLSPLPGIYISHGSFRMNNILDAVLKYTPNTSSHEISYRQLHQWIETKPELNNCKIICKGKGWEKPRIFIAGHTHEQILWQRRIIGNTYKWEENEESRISEHFESRTYQRMEALVWSTPIQPTLDQPIWLNPGSVGDPKGMNKGFWDKPWAQFAILEFSKDKESKVEFHWVPYQ